MYKKRRVKVNNFINSIVIILLVIIFIITLILLLIESETIANPFISKAYLEKSSSIIDTCSIIAGKIIHPIDRDEDCQTKCIALCEVKKLQFDNSIFERKENNCNICTCNCK